MSSSSDNMLAFLMGAAIGGVAALLLAPDKGEVTRKKIKKGISDIQDRGEDYYEEAEKALRDAAKELSDAAKHQVDAVKEAISEGKDTYKKELAKGSKPEPKKA